MKKAEIKIEVVVGDSGTTSYYTDVKGELWEIMLGLTNAIKQFEEKVPEENRSDYRTDILKMLNNRD